MSIAVSTVVHPSRLLCLARLMFCIGNLVAASFISTGDTNSASLSLLSGMVCLVSAIFGIVGLLRIAKARQIDISGLGQIRVTVYRTGGSECRDNGSETAARRDRFALMPGSTLWPRLLVLLLRGAEGRVLVLPVLPDSVAPEVFRALSLACRTIAAQGAQGQSIDK